jgi:hypothetical protein
MRRAVVLLSWVDRLVPKRVRGRESPNARQLERCVRKEQSARERTAQATLTLPDVAAVLRQRLNWEGADADTVSVQRQARNGRR